MPHRTILAAALAAALTALPSAGAGQRQAVETLAVPAAFDGARFNYRIEPAAENEGFRVYRLSYPSAVHTALEQNNRIPAELYLPRGLRPGGPRRPAVVCLHILDGNVELVEMCCSALARRGIAALWFHLPYYGPRGTARGPHALAADPAMFATAVAQAVQDVRRSVDVLAARPEIDPQRIGVMGISLGGILAATAAERDPRIARAALILSGGDLLPVVYQARETQELAAMIRGLPPEQRRRIEQTILASDPLRDAGLLRARAEAGRVLMINAARDEVIPRACTEKLAAGLGLTDRVVWLAGLGHYTALAALSSTLQTTVEFFAQDLPPEAPPAPGPPGPLSPQRTIAGLLARLAELLTAEPQPGRCHLADVELSARDAGGRKIEGRMHCVRGRMPNFSLACQLPGLGQASVGWGDYPWLVAGQRTVLKGLKPEIGPAGGAAEALRTTPGRGPARPWPTPIQPISRSSAC